MEKIKIKVEKCEDCPNFTLTHWGYWCILLNTDVNLDKIEANCPLKNVPEKSNQH